MVALGVAPGGLIKQCILEDTNRPEIWERDRTVCFNVQILNSDTFQQVTGKAPPSTPISAKTYADQGLPFYKIYGEMSAVKGGFNGLKSVEELDKIKNGGVDALGPNEKAEDLGDGTEKNESLHDDEQASRNPIVLLNPDGTAMGKFTPVYELMEELSRMKLRESKVFQAEK